MNLKFLSRPFLTANVVDEGLFLEVHVDEPLNVFGAIVELEMVSFGSFKAGRGRSFGPSKDNIYYPSVFRQGPQGLLLSSLLQVENSEKTLVKTLRKQN